VVYRWTYHYPSNYSKELHEDHQKHRPDQNRTDCNKFLWLDSTESIPDHSTFWRFRQQLERRALMEPLLQEINGQLIEQGLYIKLGGVSIVDASVIEAKQSRPNKTKSGDST